MKYKQVKSFLRQTNRERRSFFYLVFFLIVLASIYFIVHFWTRPRSSYLLNPLPREPKGPAVADPDSTVGYQETSRLLKKFNPNTVDASTLVSFGLPSKVARNWIKYVQSGGRFKDIQGISRIYGMTPEWCKVMSPWMQFETRTQVPAPLLSVSTPSRKKRWIELDPNTASIEQFMDCGIPDRLSRTIINFRAKGGSFDIPEDLLKIYGMTDSLLLLIRPYLKFQSREHPTIPTGRIYVDLNRSDTSDWKKLPGIGSVLARRIVAFRESLGGFVRPEQLAEVFGLRDSTLQAILPNLTPSPLFRKIELNKGLPLERPHPYLSVKDSRTIANFIHQNGDITGPEGLTRLQAFDTEFWERLLPYLNFEAANTH